MDSFAIQCLFNQLVSPLIELPIDAEHVYTDKNGWSYHIPKRSLQPNRPLILVHHNGFVFMVIPYHDWELLEQESISVPEYINSSVWNFGYYLGGDSLLYGVQWQPLENGNAGINDSSRINRYLSLLICHMQSKYSRRKPSKDQCLKCSIQNCPLSKYQVKKDGVSLANEVKEVDDRILLYYEVSEIIKKRFEFDAISCLNHAGETVLMFPDLSKYQVHVYLPQDLLIDMQYNPGKYNIQETAESLKFEPGISWYYNGKDFVPSTHIAVPDNAGAKFCYKFWETDARFEWFKSKKTFSQKFKDLFK